MSPEITLVWIGAGEPPSWPEGKTLRADSAPASVAECVARELPESSAAAWLFWTGALGPPDARIVAKALTRPGDLWHAGLRLGMAGLPRAIDHVAPTWMLNRDPDPTIEATSWRLSLEACLVRTEVLRRLGGIRPEFQTLAAASLELGHRFITRGALMRHLPWLSPAVGARSATELPLEDEMRFIYYRFGRRWLRWSLLRSVLTHASSVRKAIRLDYQLDRDPVPPVPPPLRELTLGNTASWNTGKQDVTVLIPTVDRYPYLEKLLDQLRSQTVRPLEIVVVDQTSPERRIADLAERFSDLPLRVFHLERPGQCSSRNAGLLESRGDYILFVDDDDEVPPDLIEKHLSSMRRFRSEVSCGVADEDGAGPLPEAFRLVRASDVFPTNNSMIMRDVLGRSGLFDLAFDHGARADRDLGMRMLLSGALMVLNADISVIHHHAPSGGLRIHKARVVTFVGSRRHLLQRHLPSVTEVYLAHRYFSPRQVREMLWLAALGTLAARGPAPRRLLKSLIGLVRMPSTLLSLRGRSRAAKALLRAGPRIAYLPGGAQPVARIEAASREGS